MAAFREPVYGVRAGGLPGLNSPGSSVDDKSAPWKGVNFRRVGKYGGLWRSGSALPWHGRGRGFDSRQLHQLFTKQGGTAGTNSRPFQGRELLICRCRVISGEQKV